MIYRRRGKRSTLPGGFFHLQLENERTRTRVTGHGYGDHIRLKDEYGNVWSGTAERRDDDVYYSFRDHEGHVLTGMSNSFIVVVRDERGNTWKGFVD